MTDYHPHQHQQMAAPSGSTPRQFPPSSSPSSLASSYPFSPPTSGQQQQHQHQHHHHHQHHQPSHSMSADSGPTAHNMSQSSSSAEPSGFDLPPMPVPYEDFHFSLDLPDNIEASDLSLLEKGDFDTLFGPSSVTGTPAIISSSALFGTATPAVHTPASGTSMSKAGPTTDHNAAANNQQEHEMHDSIMSSMPSESTPTAATSGYDPSQGPPPPPDFQPPPQPDGQSMFSFDSLFGGNGGSNFSEHGQQSQPQQQIGGIAIPSNSSQPPMPLFDTSETDFLSNFLEGFEASWDFNPTLPDNMPSYAAAQSRMGATDNRGTPSSSSGQTVTTPSRDGPYARNKRGHRGSSAASHPTPPDPQQQQMLQQQQFFQQHYNGYSHPPHGHVFHQQPHARHRSHSNDAMISTPSSSSMPAAAVFGGPLSEVAEDEPDAGRGTGSKRSFTNGRVGEEKRRGSLAQVGNGFYQQNAAGWLPGMEGYAMGGAPHSFPDQRHHQQHPQYFQQPPPPGGHGFGGQHLHPQHAAPPHRTSPSWPMPGAGKDSSEDSGSNSNSTPKRELLTEKEKRQNHILSEQRRRNHIREGFTELVSLLDLGRLYGARGLGLSSGAGTGIEDEGLDDRTDVSSDEDSDEEAAALAKARRKKARAKKNALLAAAAGGGHAGGGASRGRGKGRGRGGSAGGGAGSKSAVLFQAVDLIKWLEVRNAKLEEECVGLEEESGLGSEPLVVGEKEMGGVAA